jgi:hypothetical protein
MLGGALPAGVMSYTGFCASHTWLCSLLLLAAPGAGTAATASSMAAGGLGVGEAPTPQGG